MTNRCSILHQPASVFHRCRGVVVRRADSYAGVLGSSPARVTLKMPLVRKAAGNQRIKSTSLEKNLGTVALISISLEIECAKQFRL